MDDGRRNMASMGTIPNNAENIYDILYFINQTIPLVRIYESIRTQKSPQY